MRLFGRDLELLVGGRNVSGLRVAFKITKSLGPKVGACEVVTYNLSRETAAAAAEPGAKVMLSAGYEGDRKLLFVGDMDTVATEKQGADRVTRMRAGDGLAAARLQRKFEALAAGLNPGQMMARLAETAGVAAGDAKEKLATDGVGAAVGAFANGIVASARSTEQFEKFAESLDYLATVRDEALLLLREGASDGQEAVSLSPDSGMIGSPTMGKEQSPTGRTQDVLRVRSLLNGDLQPGRALRVQGAMVDGWFVVHAVTHQGDTHGGDWYSDVEAIPA